MPEKFRGRRFYQHNPDRDADAHHAGGERRARQGDRPEGQRRARADGGACAAAGRVGDRRARGNRSGGREADDALFQSLRNWMSPQVRLIELDLHINDAAFAETAVRTLREMMP